MLKKISIPIKYICSHPLTKDRKLLGFARFLKWQIKSRFSKKNHQINWFNNLKLSIHKGMHGATGCIYVGLPEFNDMSFLLHLLDDNSRFIDIGANVGVYSLLAAGIKNTKTIAIEPIPQTFKYLEKNIQLNQLNHLITCFNIGLSDQKGELYFTKDKDTINHVTKLKNETTLSITVDTLDNIIEHNNLPNTLIKLDVEGFEYHVLSGANKILTNKNIVAIIVELNGSSNKFNLTDNMVDELLISYGFKKYDYNPFKRELSELGNYHDEANTLYIRNSKVSQVKKQLISAIPFQILNKTI